jgi:hypothetical protein
MSANGFFAWGVDGTDVVAARPESKSKSKSLSKSRRFATMKHARLRPRGYGEASETREKGKQREDFLATKKHKRAQKGE